jgi:pSer/pThr/pTyr-binding forkhead associated (FHA) protein/thioesterase domain-containing protein
MTTDVSDPRALAQRVAKALRERGNLVDAVLVLAAWAATGPNDEAGQALLAEALRIEPNSAVAKMAFERMEGLAGDHAELDRAILRFTADELAKLEQKARPVFQRAQVGFNNNVKHKGKAYHVQTEDSGLGNPHVITHVFADGGRVIKSHKRSYVEARDRDDVVAHVRALMKGQHMEMVQMLRDGVLDPIIEGKRLGGMEVLERPPAVEVAQVGGPRPRAEAGAAPAAKAAPPANAPVRVTLHVQRSLSGGPLRYDPPGDSIVLGSAGSVTLPGERFCHRQEAVLTWEDERLWLDDLEGGNGVFIRIRTRVGIGMGDEFVVGDQLLRVLRNPDPDDGPADGPTYFLSSPHGRSAFRVEQILEGGATCACATARESLLQIGSGVEFANDLVLKGDPLVAKYHCVLEEQAETLLLTDLGARSGVFVRVKGRQALAHGDELLLGRTRLLVELPASGAAS